MINFQDVKTKEDIIKECNSEVLNVEGFGNPAVIEAGFIAYKNLDTDKEKKLLELVKFADKKYKKPTVEIGINSKKVNSIITGIVILDKYYNHISSLTTDELMTLSYFLSNIPLDLFAENIKIYKKDILESICNKYKDVEKREMLFEIVNNQLNKKELKLNGIKWFIDNLTSEEYDNFSKEIFEQISDDVIKNFGV